MRLFVADNWNLVIKKLLIFLLVFSFLLLSSTPVFADAPLIKLSELYSNSKSYDGKTLRLRGEILSIKIKKEGGYFLQLNDDPYVQKSISEGARPSGTNISIAIFVRPEHAEKIKNYGDYLTKGDIVEVEGVFNLTCSEHGGETDFHVTDLKILRYGGAIKHKLDITIFYATVFLFVISGALFIIRETISKKRER